MATLWLCPSLGKTPTASPTLGKTAQEDEEANPLKPRLGVTCLFCKHWVARELREVQEFQVQGPKFCQDAASSGCPAPAPAHATARRGKGALTARKTQPGEPLPFASACAAQGHGKDTHTHLGHTKIFSSSSIGWSCDFPEIL